MFDLENVERPTETGLTFSRFDVAMTNDSTPQVQDTDNFNSLLNAVGHAIAENEESPLTSASTYTLSPNTSRRGSKQTSRHPQKAPRDHRPMYSQEEADAILFLRDSVQLSWKQVVDAWNKIGESVMGQKWGIRTISGLQSHYYRMLGIEKGAGRRSSAPNPAIGLLKTTNRRYWWCYVASPELMNELIEATAEELKAQAKKNIKRLRYEAHKEGRQRKLAKRLAQRGPSPASARDIIIQNRDVLEHVSDFSGDDGVSSVADTLERQSISDVDGYESSTSNKSQASSKSSAPPTSPPASIKAIDLQCSPQGINSTTPILPPILSLLGTFADKGAKSEASRSEIKIWQGQVHPQAFPFPQQEPIPTTFCSANKNPMAVANLLTC